MAQNEATRQLRKYLNSQNLYTSIRMTAAALIPAFILYHYDLLLSAISLYRWVLFSPVLPIARDHFITGATAYVISIVPQFFCDSDSRRIQCLFRRLSLIAIVVFGMFFSLIAVYGSTGCRHRAKCIACVYS